MFSSAMNYLAGAATSMAAGAGVGQGSAPVPGCEAGISQDDPLVGSVVEVGEMRVFIRRRIGEGGFAFVYHAEDTNDRSKSYALKRLLAMDSPKRQQIIQEISFMKGLSSNSNIVKFVTAATVDASSKSMGKCDEFLVLMEYCPRNLADVIRARSKPYPPATVAKIFCQLVQAVQALHNSKPAIIHRDLKLENLLIDSTGKKLKLCDFGSATTQTYHPTPDWSLSERTRVEEEMAQHTTPMYRAPEMLDLWSNYPIDTSADVWALGCTLYFLCFNQHPFEDSAKLAIVNGNYRLPTNDFTYSVFHDLIKQMLVVDPSFRPSCSQILEHLTSAAFDKGIDVTADIDFELSPVTTPDQSTLYSMSSQDSPVNPSPQHRPAPQGPSASQAASAGGAGLISSLRGGAGHLIHKLKDTSKAVLQSVSGRGLDIHLITERVAAMSYPSDGLESALRHHIDDVSAVIENCHANHYAVVNLTERRYSSSKFNTGVLIDAGWKTTGPTALHVVLETVDQCLKYLKKDSRNVIVVHCLDGKSNTAVLISSILIACKFVKSPQDALRFFELKRCTPNVENYHRTLISYVSKVYTEQQLTSHAVTITSLVLEPVPLFTKQADGCKPFVQMVKNNQSDDVITVPATDYSSLQSFTLYDEEVVLKMSLKACGDVTLSVFHARQSFGGLFSKMDGVLIARTYFHTGFLPATGSCLKWKLSELDGITSPDRFGPNFKLVVNFRFDKDTPQTRAVALDYDMSLIFNSKMEYETNHAMLFGGDTATSPPPVAPPRSHRSNAAPPIPPKPEKSRTPSPVDVKPQIIADLLVEPSPGPPVAKPHTQNHTRLMAEASLTRPASDTLLLDLGANGSHSGSKSTTSHAPSVACTNQSVDVLLNLSGATLQKDPFFKAQSDLKTVTSAASDLFGGAGSSRDSPIEDFFGPPVSQASSSVAPDLFANNTAMKPDLFGPPNDMPDLFSSTSVNSRPAMPDLFGGPSQQQPDLFSAASNIASSGTTASRTPDLFGANLFGGASSSSQASSAKPVLSPMNVFQTPKTVGDELLSTLLGDLDMKPSTKPTQPNPASSAAVANQRKPNYNSSFFQPTQQAPKSKLNEDTFNDLLGGFSASNGPSNASKTIGEMKKREEMKTMDPNEAKIHEWKSGKSRNLRALLCSLDAVIWSDSRWSGCGMHQLVNPSDVKKMYKKACLAVHPDKQVGTPNEELAKLIFMELNDAWSEFENQSEQIGL